MEKTFMLFNLQLFAGEGAGDGGAGAAESGVSAQPDAAAALPRRAGRTNKFDGVHFGRVREENMVPAASRDAGGEGTAQKEQTKMSYEDLIKSDDYKDAHAAHVKKIVDGRLKGMKALQDRDAQMKPIMDMLGKFYNVQGDDLDGIMRSLSQDSRFYEEQAMREGVPVELVMQREQLNRRQAAIDAAEQQHAQERRNQQEMNELLRQAVELKSQVPDFDLMANMQNPEFKRMVMQPPYGAGVPIKNAYFALNYNQIAAAQRAQQEAAMQTVAREAAQKVASSVAAGAMRPAENGMSAASTGTMVRSDPSAWTAEERREVARRAKLGQRIEI